LTTVYSSAVLRRIRFRIGLLILGSQIQIRIRVNSQIWISIKVRSWNRIHIRIKIKKSGAVSKWRVEGHNEALQSLLSVAMSDSHHSDVDPVPDPHKVKSRILISIKPATVQPSVADPLL
jgi:hypothetical protein